MGGSMIKVNKHGEDCCDLCNSFASAFTSKSCELCNCHKEKAVEKKAIETFKILLVCTLVVVWGYLVFSPAYASAAVLQSNEGTSVDTENFGTSGGFKGQSFEHSTDFDITSIEIWGGVGNSPATLANIRVYDGDGTGGTEVCTETNIDVSGWPNWSSADWQELTLSSCTGLLESNTYTFVLEAVDGSSSDALRWATSDTSYSLGVEYFNNSARSSRDAMFRVNGTETGGGGGGTSTPTTTDATSTVLAINTISVTLLTFFGLLAFIIGVIIPLWLWKFFTR